MKKVYKYGIAALVGFFLLFNSVSIKSLDEVKRQKALASLDPAEFARDFWDDILLKNLNRTVDANALIAQLAENPEEARERFARQVGIGAYYAMISGEGNVVQADEDGVLLSIKAPESAGEILIATDLIFGNAIRDASGLLDVNDFPSSTDFNSISVEINRIVVNEVIPLFKNLVAPGKTLAFVGASELTRAGLSGKPLQVIPIAVEIK